MAAPNKLILQVGFWNAAEGSTYKTMAFASNMSVVDAHNLIAAKGNLKAVKDQYGLFVKPLEAGDVGIWMKMEDKLSEYNLANKGGIMFKLLPQPLQVTHEGTQSSLPIDTQVNVSECIKQIVRLLSLPEGEYAISKTSDKTSTPLDNDRPLAEQIEARGAITIKKKKGGILRSNARKSRAVLGPGAAAGGTKIIHPVFGRPIAQVTQMGVHGGLPVVVSKCISYLEEEALQLEGIFRISGNQMEIQDLKRRFDEGIDVNVREASSPHCISGLLKLYLRELPEPLFTHSLYDTFVALFDTVKDKAIRTQYIKVLLDTLPLPNRLLIRRFLPFLNKVIENEAVNKMAIHNVATVVGPNLLRSPEETPFLLVQHTPAVNEISCDILRNWKMMVDEGDYDFIAIGTATYSYKAQSESELNFNVGDVIFVIKEDDETGWWEGEVRGEYGFFPINYVNVFLRLNKRAAAAAAPLGSSSNANNDASSSSSSSEPDNDEPEPPKAEIEEPPKPQQVQVQAQAQAQAPPKEEKPQPVAAEPKLQQTLANAAQAIEEREAKPSRGRGGRGGGGAGGESGGMSKKQFLQELDDIRKQVVDQSNSRNELEALTSGLSTEVKQLKQRVNELQSASHQASSSTPQAGISTELSESLLNDVDFLKSENSILRTEVEQLKKATRDASSALLDSRTNADQLQRELEECNESNKALRNELKSAVVLVRELTMNFARLKGTVESLQSTVASQSSSSPSPSPSPAPVSASPVPVASGPRFPTPTNSGPRVLAPIQSAQHVAEVVSAGEDEDDDGIVIDESAHAPGRPKLPPSTKTVNLGSSTLPSAPPPSLSSQSRRVAPAGRGGRRLITTPGAPPSPPSEV